MKKLKDIYTFRVILLLCLNKIDRTFHSATIRNVYRLN